MNLCDIKTVRQIMSMFHLTFHKEFGQNFLTDRMVVEDIAEECCFDKDSTILEIGPGIGTLTYELALRHKQVISLEIDRGLIPVLDYTLREFDNVRIINEDVMQTDLDALLSPAFASGKVSVCANLPYYITSPILTALLEAECFEAVTVMVQKEVAQRIAAAPGTADYSAFTVFCQFYAKPELLFDVPAHCFMPQPKVTSAVITLRTYEKCPWDVLDKATFFRTVRASFAMRRKKLSNGLASGFPQLGKDGAAAVIAACGFSENVRGETLSIEEFATLSNAIYRRINCD